MTFGPPSPGKWSQLMYHGTVGWALNTEVKERTQKEASRSWLPGADLRNKETYIRGLSWAAARSRRPPHSSPESFKFIRRSQLGSVKCMIQTLSTLLSGESELKNWLPRWKQLTEPFFSKHRGGRGEEPLIARGPTQRLTRGHTLWMTSFHRYVYPNLKT